MTFWPAILGLGFVFGVGGGELRRFERDAALEIRQKLQGEQVQVAVASRFAGPLDPLFGDVASATIRARDFSTEGLPLYTEPWRSRAGKLRELCLELENFTLAGLAVKRLTAKIPDCRFDLGLALKRRQIRLSRSGVGTGEVEVTEQALADWILKKFREIKRVAVRVAKDRVVVEGYGEFLMAKSEFQVIASLSATDDVRLELTDAKIYFGWVRAGEAASRALLDTLNPVVDLDRDLHLDGAVKVEGIRLRDGVLKAWGATRIPDLPAESQGG